MSRRKQQLVGTGIALFGSVLTAWNWYTALHHNYFYIKLSLLAPAFVILGLGLIIFPGYKEERTARGQDISKLQGLKLVTPRWWAIIVVALIAGGMNYWLLFSLK